MRLEYLFVGLAALIVFGGLVGGFCSEHMQTKRYEACIARFTPKECK